MDKMHIVYECDNDQKSNVDDHTPHQAFVECLSIVDEYNGFIAKHKLRLEPLSILNYKQKIAAKANQRRNGSYPDALLLRFEQLAVKAKAA